MSEACERTVRCSSVLRCLLWRAVCWLVGGLTVSGRLPRGGCVVVANHSSHADTAALLAALPASSRPVFAAAADYWFAVPARRAAATGLAGILPVHRGGDGAYAALLAAAGPALAAGRAVVVYPEGTRTTDGSLGEFRSGAVRLARDCGVPIVPVAVLGTRDVLPKHGRLRSAPMEVRVGTPRRVPALTERTALSFSSSERECRSSVTAEATALRDDVVALLGRGPARVRTSPVWARVARVVSGPQGLLVGFGWGFGEALSWPVMAEMTLVFLAAAVPSRVPALASSIVAGSLTGVLVNARLVAHGVRLPAPLTTPRMQATALSDLGSGAPGVLHQALSGIPIKLYARAAGELGIDPWSLLVWAGIERGLRMAAVALLVWLVARRCHGRLRRCYGTYLLLTGAGFAAVLALIVAAWS